MNDLQTTLDSLIKSGTESNPALNKLLIDYTNYHLVFVIVGSLFLFGFLTLSIFFLRRFKNTQKTDNNNWPFAKKTYFWFGLLSVLVGFFLVLLVMANVSNVVHPRQGFLGTISMLSPPAPNTPTFKLHKDINAWLQSDRAKTPELLQNRVDERLAWQRLKAIICIVLLAVFVVLSFYTWRKLLSGRFIAVEWTTKELLLFATGIILVIVCLLLMLMVLGNTQASLAPISLTLFYSN